MKDERADFLRDDPRTPEPSDPNATFEDEDDDEYEDEYDKAPPG